MGVRAGTFSRDPSCFFDRVFRLVQADELSYDEHFMDAAELLMEYRYRPQGRGQRVLG